LSESIGPRFVGIGKETTFGSPVTVTRYIDAISESITSDQQWIDTETAAYREFRVRIPGPYKVGGDFDFYLNADDVCEPLLGALGSITTTPDSTPSPVAYKHEIKPGTSIPTWTLEISPGVGTYSRQVAGAAFSAVSIEATARDAPTMTCTVIAKKDARISRTTPTYTGVRMFAGFEGKVYRGTDEVADIEAIRINIENDIPDDVYALGDRFLKAIIPQRLTVSGDMDIRFTSWDWWSYFWGSSTATEPQAYPSTVGLKLEFTGDSTGSTVQGFQYYKLTLEMPKCTLNTMEASFDRRDRVVASLGFTALYDSTLGGCIKATVINKRQSV
jgi:hypothetical protein